MLSSSLTQEEHQLLSPFKSLYYGKSVQITCPLRQTIIISGNYLLVIWLFTPSRKYIATLFKGELALVTIIFYVIPFIHIVIVRRNLLNFPHQILTHLPGTIHNTPAFNSASLQVQSSLQPSISPSSHVLGVYDWKWSSLNCAFIQTLVQISVHSPVHRPVHGPVQSPQSSFYTYPALNTCNHSLHGSLYSVDWTTGLEYWTGLLDSPLTPKYQVKWSFQQLVVLECNYVPSHVRKR